MENRKKRNVVMWMRSTEDRSMSNFENRKAFAYHKFFKKINERDNFRFAIGVESYIDNGVFSNVSVYKDRKIINTDEPFKADVIYHYSKLAGLDFSTPSIITNTPQFRNFCSPKINTYQYMPEFFPKTFSVFNKQALLRVLPQIKTDKVVLKPNRGHSGNDVFIFDKHEVDLSLISEEILHDQGFLVQEFIDTSAGIPGIVSSYHDFRIVTHGDRVSLCHIRQPVIGSLISNFHKGASIKEVEIDSIPQFILDFYKKVHGKIIEKYPKPLYSMDIGIGKDGPVLIELNSHTAFPGEDFKCMDRFIDNLIYHLETIE